MKKISKLLFIPIFVFALCIGLAGCQDNGTPPMSMEEWVEAIKTSPTLSVALSITHSRLDENGPLGYSSQYITREWEQNGNLSFYEGINPKENGVRRSSIFRLLGDGTSNEWVKHEGTETEWEKRLVATGQTSYVDDPAYGIRGALNVLLDLSLYTRSNDVQYICEEPPSFTLLNHIFWNDHGDITYQPSNLRITLYQQEEFLKIWVEFPRFATGKYDDWGDQYYFSDAMQFTIRLNSTLALPEEILASQS